MSFGWLKAIGKGLGKGVGYLVVHPEILQGVIEGAQAVKAAKAAKKDGGN